MIPYNEYKKTMIIVKKNTNKDWAREHAKMRRQKSGAYVYWWLECNGRCTYIYAYVYVHICLDVGVCEEAGENVENWWTPGDDASQNESVPYQDGVIGIREDHNFEVRVP